MITCAMVLAAGKSRRMGCQKLLLPLGGIPMIRRVVDEILASPVDRTFVVVGEDATQIQRALEGCRVEVVVNDSGRDDMLASVRCGLQAFPGSCGAILVVLGDQPGLKRSLVAGLISAAQTTGRNLVVPVYGGHRGHPLLFSARFKDEVMTEFDGTGLRGLLAKHPAEVFEFPTDSPAVIEDIDTLEDYHHHFKTFQ